MDERALFAAGALNGALYLIFVFLAGVWHLDPLTWKLAIASTGVTYLTYLAQILVPERRRFHVLLCAASIVLGAWAGLSLLWERF